MGKLDDTIEKIVALHHDAFMVDLLGPDNCGLPPERVQQLKSLGLIANVVRPKLGASQDPLAFTVNLAAWMTSLTETPLTSELMHEMQLAPLADTVARMPYPGARSTKDSHPSEASPGSVLLHDQQHPHSPDMPKPELPEMAIDSHFSPPRKPPPGVGGDGGPGRVTAYLDGVQRIGSYCKGLGSQWNDALKSWVGETWEGDAPTKVPKPGARSAAVDRIRDVVLQAWKDTIPAGQLARKLAAATGDFGRNWKRIAETELQALYNETALRSTVEKWGGDARVARVPESAACDDCRRLFLDKKGVPILWEPLELLKNGTNVGKKKAAWKATLYPIHPKCRCNAVGCPPGTYVDARGYLWWSKPTRSA